MVLHIYFFISTILILMVIFLAVKLHDFMWPDPHVSAKVQTICNTVYMLLSEPISFTLKKAKNSSALQKKRGKKIHQDCNC